MSSAVVHLKRGGHSIVSRFVCVDFISTSVDACEGKSMHIDGKDMLAECDGEIEDDESIEQRSTIKEGHGVPRLILFRFKVVFERIEKY